MNNNHLVTFRPITGKVRSVLAVIVLLALVGSTLSQSQPARISKRIKSILSGRAIERAPVRAPRKVRTPPTWSTTLPKIQSGATVTTARQGSLVVGNSTLTLRKPRTNASALPPTPPVRATANSSGALNTKSAQELAYAKNLIRHDPRKVSLKGRNVTGAAIRNAEQRAAASKAKADKTLAYERTNPAKLKTSKIYKRPSRATVEAQRTSVQGKRCATCDRKAPKMYADHKWPLVQEHYETGKINKRRMRSVKAIQPQCPQCSHRQGAVLSQYSRQQRKRIEKNNERSH